MGIEPTQDLLGPTLVLKTRSATRRQSPPQSVALWLDLQYTASRIGTKDFSACGGDTKDNTYTFVLYLPTAARTC